MLERKMFSSLIILLICLTSKAWCNHLESDVNNKYRLSENDTSSEMLERFFFSNKQVTNINQEQASFYSKIIKLGICGSCVVGVEYLYANLPYSSFELVKRTTLAKDLKTYCIFISPFLSIRACIGLIDINIDFIMHVLRHRRNPLVVCSTVLQSFGCFRNSQSKWRLNIPSTSVGLNSKYQLISKVENLVLSKDHPLKKSIYRILHLTDFHVDPLYKKGSPADCREPLCCQKDQGFFLSELIFGNKSAGEWGSYGNCDVPYNVLENLFNQIVNQINQMDSKISFIYFTGDIISHRLWSTTRRKNSIEIKKVYKMMKSYFKSIAIYPILGNHEPSPPNVYSPLVFQNITKLSTTWIFDVVAEEWADFLPKTALETIKKGGYYTVLAKPGLRIVALNSNVCFIFNCMLRWLIYNPVDPYGQLKWLTGVLLDAEKSGEAVHILSHIPPGNSLCLNEWSVQFRRIVQRFANTIMGQFNGHTHFDEFHVFYDTSNTNKAINVAFSGGSVTTYKDLNPNYRFYEVDSNTNEILDYEEWIYDVSEANKHPGTSPIWYKLYRFTEAYKVPSTRPQDIGELVERMKNHPDLLQKYYTFKVRNATPSMVRIDNFKKQIVCEIMSTASYEAASCTPITLTDLFSFLS